MGVLKCHKFSIPSYIPMGQWGILRDVYQSLSLVFPLIIPSLDPMTILSRWTFRVKLECICVVQREGGVVLVLLGYCRLDYKLCVWYQGSRKPLGMYVIRSILCTITWVHVRHTVHPVHNPMGPCTSYGPSCAKSHGSIYILRFILRTIPMGPCTSYGL